MRDLEKFEQRAEALRRERGKVPWLSEGGVQQGSQGSNPGYNVVDTGARSGYR